MLTNFTNAVGLNPTLDLNFFTAVAGFALTKKVLYLRTSVKF
jgi:UPF0716 family protein affecting phage T7 exclusion